MKSFAWNFKVAATLLGMMALIAAGACGDDDSSTPTIDASTASDASTATDSSTASDASSSSGNACMNASDMAAVARENFGSGMNQNLTDVAANCARGSCLSVANDPEAFPACIAACVRMSSSDAVSEGCADCYGLSANCSAANCTGPCVNPTTPEEEQACTDCRCGENTASENCVEAFEACAGVAATTTCGS